MTTAPRETAAASTVSPGTDGGASTSRTVEGSGRPSHPWLSLLCVCLGMAMTFVNITATISSLGPIQSDLHLTATTLVWVTSAYSLAVAGLTLSAGTIGDLLGRRTVFLAGTAILGIGSLVCFFTDSSADVITGQAVMGVGGAMVLPNSLTVVSTSFHDARRRTEAISIWVGFSGIGLAAGPLIAGVLLAHFSWHSVFLVNAVISALVLLATPFFVVDTRHLGRRIDIPGVLLATVSVVALTYAVIQGSHVGYTNGHILTAWTFFLLGLVVFLVVESRSADPMLDLRLFRSVSFSTTMAVGAAGMFGFGGVPLIMVLYFERVQDTSALNTGWRLMPTLAVYVLVSAVAARLVARVGFKTMLSAGLVVTALGAVCLLATPANASYEAVWPGMVIFGLGEGLVLAPTTAAAVTSVGHDKAGMASAAVNMFRQLGNVLGTSIIGSLLTSHFAHILPQSLRRAGVPAPVAAHVAHAVSDGSSAHSPDGAEAAAIGHAIAHAFTDSVHIGLMVTAAVLIVVAIPAALFVIGRNPVGRA
ncbi:MFS transporter [Streptomyces mexicanus]|uniref:MFS transporter n=1 Tax=Streptomyces mexicanus TaxID=178566 RepID=UPI0036AB7539